MVLELLLQIQRYLPLYLIHTNEKKVTEDVKKNAVRQKYIATTTHISFQTKSKLIINQQDLGWQKILRKGQNEGR